MSFRFISDAILFLFVLKSFFRFREKRSGRYFFIFYVAQAGAFFLFHAKAVITIRLAAKYIILNKKNAMEDVDS